jgi:hypothetical protein
VAVTEGLLAAARNITYPEEEKPIRDLLDDLGRYEALIGQAFALYDQNNQEYLARHRQADEVMHDHLLKSADALDQANFDHLTSEYKDQRRNTVWTGLGIGLSGLLLLATLAGVQAYLARRTHRLLNSALLSATVIALFGLVITGWSVWRGASHLRRAKEDAFDSIHVLMQARAEGQDARGDTLRLLLDKNRRKDYEDAFEKKSGKLVQLAPNLTPAQLRDANKRREVPDGFKGYLADELRNITFPGEEDAARQTLDAYLISLESDRKVRAAGEDEAVHLAVGGGSDQSSAAFNRFDTALDRTLRINREAFDDSVANGFAALAGFDVAGPVVGLIIAVLAYFGMRPRLREYDFS